jgi:GT2 family glycosyltransferase
MSDGPFTPDPRLAVIVLNHNGRHHLEPCLTAILGLAGLLGPEAVVVADNGSSDGSADLVRQAFPGATVLPLGANLGFAEGNNRAAEATPADYLLFLNNDTRIAPDALTHLWPAIQAGAVCAGARLVSWDGRRLDFDGGGAAFTGHGHALGFGRPVPAVRTGAGDQQFTRSPNADGQPHPTLFASGAAMLIERATFLAVGGFDPDYFAYYEDVDLGWRLWLAGHSVMQVPAAIVHHRHHGTADRLPSGLQARLYERNALATVVKNYDDDHLARVLPAALALAACRASGADPDEIIEGALVGVATENGAVEVLAATHQADGIGAGQTAVIGASANKLPLPSPDWPGWPLLADLDLDFEALALARAHVQGLRRRPDSEILPLLVHPYAPVPPTAAADRALRAAVARFGLESVFGPLPAEPADARGPAAWGRLLGRGAGALREGGPAWLAEELRGYLAWRRQREERRS